MNARIKIWLASLVVAAGCLVGLALPATAADDIPAEWIQISPVSRRLDLKPSENQDSSIKVTNVGSKALNFKVYASPYFVKDISAEPVFETDSHYVQLAKWISFDQVDYTDLAPGESIDIPFHITVPADAPGGGQYAVVFAETSRTGEAASSGSSIQTVGRVGSIVYAHLPGDIRLLGNLETMEQKAFFIDESMNATTTVRNEGNIDFNIRYDYTVSSIFGKELYSDNQNRVVLPGVGLKLDAQWDGPMFGLFNVHNKVIFLGVPQYDETQLVFVSPMWLLVILIILLVAVITTATWSIVRAVKNRRSRGPRKIKKSKKSVDSI